MIALRADEFARIMGGTLHGLDPAIIITERPVFDSRKAAADTFFLALKGEKRDGHEFIAEALANGARFAIVSQKTHYPSILVEDVMEALVLLATEVRQRLAKMTVIGITGSQGKTTTKDLLFQILSTQGETISPEGSFNNELGLPLTLLSATEMTQFCILEMGARHMGDIAKLTHIARPNVGVVLVVGTAHIGEFGSRERIAQTKGELIRELPEGACAVLGTYDEFTPHMADGLSLKVSLFGEGHDCQVRAADIEFRDGRAHFDLVTPQGRQAVALQLFGSHQIANALAAASVADYLGVPLETIAATLSTATNRSKWRMEITNMSDLTVINDSYNANPESMRAAIKTLVHLSQERGGVSWAFLGKMQELGASERSAHQEIGRLAHDLGIDHLVDVGGAGYLMIPGDVMQSQTQEHACANIESALDLVDHFQPGDVILIKASRSEGLELLAEKIKERWSHLRDGQEKI